MRLGFTDSYRYLGAYHWQKGKYSLLCAKFGVLWVKSCVNLLVVAVLTQGSHSPQKGY